ncbi:MAG: PTS transporter subunit IIC [Actinomycetota bacterium]
MQAAQKVFEYIIDLGPVIIIPSLLLVLGLITGRKPHRTLLNSVFVFLGLLFTSLMLTIFINFFEPLVNIIVLYSGKNFQVIDMGMALSRDIAFSSPIVIETIIAIILLNIFMLALRLTRTINIDIWNYWIFLLIGSVIYTITEIRWMGILISLVIAAITLVLSDIYAPSIHYYYGLEGISVPQSQTVSLAPIPQLVNLVLNKIPGIRRVHLFFEEIQYRLGFFSEPMVMGFIMGFLVGLITRYRTILTNAGTDLLYSFGSGLRLAVIMIVLPRAFNLLVKGLVPILEDINSFIRRRISKREIYIGLDPLVIAGHPAVIGLSVIMVPLTVYIATILPGNTLLPSADLIFIPFLIIWAVSASRGDSIRSIISAAILIPLVLWIATDMADIYTSIVLNNNLEIAEGFNKASSIGGSNVLFWILLQILRPILNLFA